MILLKESTVEDILDDEEYKRRLELEWRERGRLEMEERERERTELDELERKLKEREDALNRKKVVVPSPEPMPPLDIKNIHKEFFHNSSIVTLKKRENMMKRNILDQKNKKSVINF